MVIRNTPKQPDGALPDLKLMEDLLKKSLEVNPGMRAGRSTHEVLQELRQQALDKARAQLSASVAAPAQVVSAPAGPAAAPQTVADKRRNTITFFFEQKAEEYERLAAALAEREAQLAAERRAAQQRIIGEMIDFLALMAGGAESEEAREILKKFRAFLSQLGTSDVEVARQVRHGATRGGA